MSAKHDFTELKKLQIEAALRDLSDNDRKQNPPGKECNASIRIMSAKFTLAGADQEAKKEIQKYLESIKRGTV